MFFMIFWTKLFWSRNQKLLDVGAGAQNCDAQSWSRSLKFKYQLHTLALQAKQRTRTNCNLIIA